MVKKYFILNSHFTFFKKVNSDNNNSLLLSKCDNNNSLLLNKCDNNNNGYDPYNENHYNSHKHENGNNKKHNYVKVLVDDPYNNRDIMLKVTKKQKGVYI